MPEESGTSAGSGWTEKEIIASVDSWVSMYKMQQAGSSFVKAEWKDPIAEVKSIIFCSTSKPRDCNLPIFSFDLSISITCF